MAGATIDHLVSLVLLVSVLLASFGVYSHMLGNAIAYQRYHQVAVKAADLVDGMCLSPGVPSDWGESNSTPSVFGLQYPKTGGYTLSPFSIQRLLPSGDSVYYDKAGMWFMNVSLSEGGSLLLPVVDCVDYVTVSRLLGINGSYGFQLSITPTLRVSVSEVDANPLRLKVEVRGPGLALSGATLKYCLYYSVSSDDTVPSIEVLSGTAETDSTGSKLLVFPSVDGSQGAYSIIVSAHLSGLDGIGYTSHATVENNHIIPFVESLKERTVLLAHSWDVHTFPPPVSALHYNATFLLLTHNFELRPIQLANSTGLVDYGVGNPYAQTQIPVSESGILLVSYRRGDEDEYGMVMMPWGINTLGVSITFGGDPSGHEWVATELRQVTVNRISYQVKLAVWSLVM